MLDAFHWISANTDDGIPSSIVLWDLMFLKSENKISSRPCIETPHHCTLVEVISVNGNGVMIMHGGQKYQSSVNILCLLTFTAR